MSGQMQKKWTKPMGAALLGGIAGYFSIEAYVWFGGGAELAEVNPMRLVLSGVGMVYLLMAVFVGLGTLVPRAGAKLLNVADSDDLIDQRAMLLGSSASSGALGAALMLMAASGPGGSVSDGLALASLAFALVLGTVLTILQWRHYDELMRQVSWESSAFGLGLLFPALVAWAALAHLGWTAALDPLGVIALSASTLLIGTFIAAGRRGMLTQG
jgi:hypothetical protein